MTDGPHDDRPDDDRPHEVQLAGAFVRLEPLSLRHIDELVDASTLDRATYAYATVPNDPETMRDFVVRAQGDPRAVAFATIDARSDRAIGSTRFLNLEFWDYVHRTISGGPGPSPTTVEIGHTWLAPTAQRTPINTEAKLLMLGHAFETWGCLRVTLKTDRRNERSRRAIERIGGQLDGILRAWQPAADGGPRDTAIYSIIASEWPNVKASLESKLV